MLSEMGITNVEELFKSIPPTLILPSPLTDDGMSEYEGMQTMESLAARNTFSILDNYLGGGAYDHHIPALIPAICSKSEFLTSYTPYQAEASQGMLQIIFEFQSAICALTGMDAANASVYDGASACAEALLMALRFQKTRPKVLVADSLHPHYKGVIEQYLKNQPGKIEWIPFLQEGGAINHNAFEEKLDEDTAAVLIQSPNFFGILEDVKIVSRLAKEKGAVTILCANPISYGLFMSAAEQGVDIAVGDCQPFGLTLGFGGPYAGYMGCQTELLRQLPGRIVGETADTKGKRGFVLTLQAREQHIRREKATSNICTNQALAALASLISMLWYGKEGAKALALTNYQRAHYLKYHLSLAGVHVWDQYPTFNEFVADFSRPIDEVVNHFRKAGIEPGIELRRYHPQFEKSLLIAVTETKNQAKLDRFIEVARELKK